MADKQQDSRNKNTDCSDCKNVKIYEQETVLFFQVEGESLQVFQKGELTVEQKEGNILFFNDGKFVFSACGVENVRKENNDIYAENYTDLVVALSDFLGVKSDSASTDTILSDILTIERQANWTSIIGNSLEVAYYAGVEAGNPSGSTSNIKTVAYKTGATTVYTQTIAYNLANNIVSVITT